MKHDDKKRANICSRIGGVSGYCISFKQAILKKKIWSGVYLWFRRSTWQKVFNLPGSEMQIDYSKHISPEQMDPIRPVTGLNSINKKAYRDALFVSCNKSKLG